MNTTDKIVEVHDPSGMRFHIKLSQEKHKKYLELIKAGVPQHEAIKQVNQPEK